MTATVSAAHRHTRKVAAGALAVVLAMSAAACSSDSGTTGSGDSAGGGDGTFPVSIDSSLGTAKIDKAPSRVVTLGWGSTEAALALGVTPVGMRNMKSDAGNDDGVLPWVKEKLNGATPELLDETSKSIPTEKIAALKPDVILAVQSGLTAEQYEQLSRIAPVVAFPGKAWQTPWQEQTKTVGKALGKEKEAQDLVSQTDATLADVKAKHPEFAGKTIASTSVTKPDGVNYYFDTDPRVQMLGAMGFTPLPALAELREQNSGGSTFAAPVSWENVSKYSPQVLTTWYGDEATKGTAEANPVFASLPAVRNKAYVPLVDPPMVYAVSSPNVLDVPWMLDRYVPELSRAANAVKK